MTKMAQYKRSSLVLAAAVIAITPVLGACSSDSSSSDSTPTATTSSAPSATETSSGDTATGTPVLGNGTAPADRTIMVSSTGMTPKELTIAVGQNVTFKADGSGTFAVTVGSLDQATVTGGLIETFDFPQAGTYPVVEVISGETATITVK
ncbi:MAG: hypothetical protein WBB44_03815 [Candidatus Nanopelagicales bacterium]